MHSSQMRELAAARCTLKVRDRVILGGSGQPGVIVQDGGYGFFEVKLDGTGKRVIRRYTELARIAG